MNGVKTRVEDFLYPYARVFYEFFLFSFLGLVFETLFVFLVHGDWTVRGTLGYGLPIIHIYGLGMLGVIYLGGRFKERHLLFFTVSVLIMTLVELAGSYLEEALLGYFSWNYGYLPFDFQGRICLPVSLAWGGMSFLIVYYLHPWVVRLIGRVPKGFLSYSSIVMTGYVVFGILRKYFLQF